MATYNGGHFLRRQIETILVQLASTDELVVSDDGSTDQTLLTINSFGDDRIKLVRNNRPSGVINNFQNALYHATGEFIFLADQDDIWLPHKIDHVAMLLKEADLVLSNCEIVDEAGIVKYTSFFDYRNSKPGFLRNLFKNPYIGCCMAFRRSVLSYALPIPTTIHMHDWWIGLLVELNGRVEFTPEITMQYIRHGSNASPTGEKSSYGPIKKISNRVTLLYSVMTRQLMKKRG